MILPHDDVGRGDVVILLHAGIADRRMWAEHLEPLSQAGYRVLTFDLPGFGDAPLDPTPPWEAVRDSMDALGIERAAVVGNSFGGAVALRLALVAPDQVAALALVSSPGLDESQLSDQLEAAWATEGEALERGDIEAAVGAVVDAWTQPDAPPELRERVAVMQRRAFELALAGPDTETALPDPLEEEPERAQLILAPTLVIVGERDMPDFVSSGTELAQALPHAELRTIPEAGHLAPLETPDAFRSLLLPFLAATAGG